MLDYHFSCLCHYKLYTESALPVSCQRQLSSSYAASASFLSSATTKKCLSEKEKGGNPKNCALHLLSLVGNVSLNKTETVYFTFRGVLRQYYLFLGDLARPYFSSLLPCYDLGLLPVFSRDSLTSTFSLCTFCLSSSSTYDEFVCSISPDSTFKQKKT